MTPNELKAHRRAICDALLEGKQCQVTVCGSWVDQQPQTVACRLFSDPAMSEEIRIKQREPRKCWVKWHPDGDPAVKPLYAMTDAGAKLQGYQLVVEDVK